MLHVGQMSSDVWPTLSHSCAFTADIFVGWHKREIIMTYRHCFARKSWIRHNICVIHFTSVEINTQNNIHVYVFNFNQILLLNNTNVLIAWRGGGGFFIMGAILKQIHRSVRKLDLAYLNSVRGQKPAFNILFFNMLKQLLNVPPSI